MLRLCTLLFLPHKMEITWAPLVRTNRSSVLRYPRAPGGDVAYTPRTGSPLTAVAIIYAKA